MTLSKTINEDVLPYDYTKHISYVDLENGLDVNTDENGDYYFNLNSTVVIDPAGNYEVLQLKQDMAWPLISYKIYGDTRETWTLMKINEATFDQVFKPVKSGSYVKYLDTTQLQQVANIMSNM